MEELPFLVVYGREVWVVALIGSLFVGPLLLCCWFWRHKRTAIRAIQSELPSPEGNLDGIASDVVTLVGQIEIQGKPTTQPNGDRSACGALTATLLGRAAHGLPTVAHERANSLWLKVGETAVALEGPVWVLAGSRVRFARRAEHLGRHPHNALGGLSMVLRRKTPAALHSVEAGDLVRVRGRITPVASTAEGYRDPALEWVLSPEEGKGAILLAIDGGPRSVRLVAPVRAVLKRIAVGALPFLVLFGLGGRLLLLGEREVSIEPVRLSNWDRESLAAATPFHRSEALEWIEWRLAVCEIPDRTTTEALIAIRGLVGGCAAKTQTLVEFRRYREAAEEARRCGSGRALFDAAKGLTYLSDFDGAAGLFEQAAARGETGRKKWPEVTRTYLMAGEWKLAAQAARAAELESASELNSVRWNCLAGALAQRAEDSASFSNSRSPFCRALATGCDQRALEQLRLNDTSDELDRLCGEPVGIDNWHVDFYLRGYTGLQFAVGSPVARIHARLLELQRISDASPTQRARRLELARTMAVIETLAGHRERAEEWAAVARTDVKWLVAAAANETAVASGPGAGPPEALARQAKMQWPLDGWLRLMAGDFNGAASEFELGLDGLQDPHLRIPGRHNLEAEIPPVNGLGDPVLDLLNAIVRRDASLVQSTYPGLPYHPFSRSDIEQAVRGDLGGLAAVDRSQNVWWGLERLGHALPLLVERATSGREALARRFRWSRSSFDYWDPCPLHLLPMQAILHDLARALGEESQADMWDEARQRSYEILLRRDLAVVIGVACYY